MIKSIALATLTLALTCLAQPPRGGGRGPEGPGGPGGEISALKSYLGLTDAQVESIRSAQKQERDAKSPNSSCIHARSSRCG